MPRVSQAVAKQTRQNIIDATIKIITLEGAEMLTFSHIAKKANISRSGINCHFKRKEDLLAEVEPILAERVSQALDFSSPEAFFASFKLAVDEDRMFRNLIKNTGQVFEKSKGHGELLEIINGDPEEVKNAVYMAIGYAVVHA
ncbi:TetR family transcriptional regulator [Vibrio sp. THAF190c]|uniref:TetR family transcriptional regulator n=1 Tax=Vibrio sp. THAF190c TaxID=2587865 RepID=UPI001267EF0A|nr:TetR family transcriptional regulator [Vibrio sp. THAF190c]QFT13543.1 putative HTH-type transcriptional regulator TtgW [Vibrio sp. THAF190c]